MTGPVGRSRVSRDVVGMCGECGRPILKAHGWLRAGEQLRHYPGPGGCYRYQRDDAFDLLRRIRASSEDGSLVIPDVAHAVEAEIKELIGDV